jgi:hypothetical protein
MRLVIAVALFVSACGQMGPLVLPQKKEATPAPAPAAPAPASPDQPAPADNPEPKKKP